jgi:flagellar biosynthesis protein FliR
MDFSAVIEEMRNQLGFKAEFTTVLLTMALLVSRVLPVIVLTPMFGGETTPTEVKFGLGMIIALVLFPGVIDRMQYIPLTPIPFVALLMKEVFVGYCIAFVVGLVFDAANVAGQLIDNMSGTNNAQLMVPSIGQQVSLYAVLKVQLCITLFLTLNGHHLVIQALGDSLASIPLDGFPRFSSGSYAFYDLIMRVFGDLLRIALAISAPVILATFLTDLALGLINRTAPQIQVFFVSMQIKPAVTALVVFAAIHLILLRVVDEYGVMFRWLRQALRLMS